MFVGISKNLGGGLRVGLGTKLGGNSKTSAKELNTQEFQNFLNKVEQDLNNSLLIFLKAKNQSFKELSDSKIDLDDVFKDDVDYKEFVEIHTKTKKNIEKILYAGDSGVVAKRSITESVFSLKEYMDNKYSNIELDEIIAESSKEKIKKPMNKLLKWLLIIFGILILIGVLGKDKKNINKENIDIVIEKKK